MGSDALGQYEAKRNFSVSPEPAEGGEASADALASRQQARPPRPLAPPPGRVA